MSRNPCQESAGIYPQQRLKSCRKILAKFGVTLADVRAQARAAGTPWVVQDVQPGVVRYRYSQSARAKKEGVAK